MQARPNDAVSLVPGVESVEVDLNTKLVHVRGTDEASVVGAIDAAGYEAVAV